MTKLMQAYIDADHMNIGIVQWAAEECYRQRSGEQSVAHMCEAWMYLTMQPRTDVSPDMIITLGMFVEPDKNGKGYRNVPVYFKDGTVVSAANIPYQIESLCEHGDILSPTQWYTEFERIHPFVDGNGRVGALLFNFLAGILHSPISPPDVFNNGSPPCL